MDKFRSVDGSLSELPKKNVDTGGGLERWLMLLENVPTVFDTDALRPLIATAESLTGQRYQAGEGGRTDTSLRVLADHARSMTFLVNDGVVPSNEERGYVVRSVIRRAARQAYQLGVHKAVLPEMVNAVIDMMDPAYPELARNRTAIVDVIGREEERFLHTLRSGSVLLDQALEEGEVSGETAFRLHDTFGFPIELTEELAEERGITVDRAGFDVAMTEQRQRAKAARKVTTLTEGGDALYRSLMAEHEPTEFTGYSEYESKARILAVVPVAAKEGEPGDRVEIFLDRTPFYAEGGGQIGDTGCITTDTGQAEVADTTPALPGLHRHLAVIVEGSLEEGQEATAAIDGERRDAIRRNHTGTHMLHWALREVLGPHVKQAGSLVAPDHLRFDFSHYGPVTPEELERIEDLANGRVLADEPVRAYETSKSYADQLGAIAFFGDKYGETVRVVEAGSRSMELCGGTHVGALGMIGTLKVVSEGSIGANMRRIFAVTGTGTLERMRAEETALAEAAEKLRAGPDELPAAIDRLLERVAAAEKEVRAARSAAARASADSLAGSAVNGVVVVRQDGMSADELKELAITVRDQGVRVVIVAGSPDGERVALAGAAAKDSGVEVNKLIGEVAKRTGGGGGGKDPTVATAGGRDVGAIDDALALAKERLGGATAAGSA